MPPNRMERIITSRVRPPHVSIPRAGVMIDGSDENVRSLLATSHYDDVINPPPPKKNDFPNEVDHPEDHADYFLSYPPQQPKREIGDYVESSGILVPKRFDSLEEALASQKTFIIRSEHPHEYEGMSGLLESHTNRPDTINYFASLFQERKKHVYGGKDEDVDPVAYAFSNLNTLPQDEVERLLKKRQPRLDYYCSLRGYDPKKFTSRVSFSYWELVEGENRVVVADSTVPEKYYFFTHMKAPTRGNLYECAITENGEVIYETGKIQTQISYPELTQFYESVRNLSRFNRIHCPVIECQTSGPDIYFLQYHRSRDFSKSEFKLEKDLPKDAIEGTLVRGTTPPEGLEVNLRIRYPKRYGGFTPIDMNDEAWGLYFDLGESRRPMADGVGVEAIAHNLDAIIFTTTPEHFLGSIRHLQISTFFNPQVFVLADPQQVRAQLGNFSDKTYIKTRIVSDGRRANIEFL